MSSRSEKLALELNAQRQAFKAFLTARLGSEAEAEDLLQNSLVKAMHHADDVREDGRAAAWFYRVLRNAVIDHYRSNAAGRRRDDAFGTLIHSLGEDIASAPAWEPQLCGCLNPIAASLKPPQAELLRRVDLDGESVQLVAKELGLTSNHASVILHRARKELRLRLERFCGACAKGKCLDCDCHAGKADPGATKSAKRR